MENSPPDINTLSLHDALPICSPSARPPFRAARPLSRRAAKRPCCSTMSFWLPPRSEEHTSELQSHVNLVCRLLLEKKRARQIDIGLVIALLQHHINDEFDYLF